MLENFFGIHTKVKCVRDRSRVQIESKMFRQVCRDLLLIRTVPAVPVRTSVWSPEYVKPVITKEELERIAVEDPERYSNLQYSKVKALDSFQNNNEFYDEFLYKMVGRVLKKGARERADKLVKETLFLIKKDRMAKARELEPALRAEFVRNPLDVMKQAWENCKPILTTQQVTRGGSKYLAPVALLESKKDKLVFSWVREVIENRPRPRPEKFPQVFAKELLLAYKNEGKLIKKKIDLYKLTEANKAYVNYVYLRR